MDWSLLFGKLSWGLLPENAVAWGGATTMVVIGLGLIGLVAYFKAWGPLWRNWLTSLDPKRIGVMYIVVALIMFVRGAADAVLMRIQQATSVGSAHGIVTASHFQEIFSAHGSIMIFFVAMGIMFGLINLIVPLQIGARDVAFPFLNSLSFWLFVAGALIINLSLILGDFSTAGWLSYPPLSELAYSPTVGVDYWLWSLQISGIGSLLSGINFLVTILKMRCKGMSLMKMPMFSWTVLGSMWLVAVSFPILTVSLALLTLDRTFGMHFFTAGGGNMMMYVNLIWAWGHPEVYVLVLPAFGIFSEVVPVFSGKKLAGYASMVYSVIAIVFLSFIVWLHHFFTMGAGADVNAFFGIMTAVIAIPTGVKMFNWIFTMYHGRIRFFTPMMWYMGFVVLFTLGGVTGVVLAEPVADYQLHNGLFLVAHFHTMIVSGVLFGYFAGLTYWFPKIFGFKLDEKWGRRAFWNWLIGFILAFGPLYVLGFMGATRRLDHYTDPSWQPLFIIAGIGAAIIVLGFACQLIQLFVSIKNRHQALDTTGDPWNGRTLEWSIPSPAPAYNFAILPMVESRDEYWQLKAHNEKDVAIQATGKTIDIRREYEDITMPRNTAAGFAIGAATFFFGFGFVWHIWWLVIVSVIAGTAFLIMRTFDEDTEYIIRAGEVEANERRLRDRFITMQNV